MVRRCGWCDADLSHKSARALYCSTQHKKNAASKRHRERNPGYYGRYNGSPTRLAWADANRSRLRAAAREQQARYRAENPDAGRAWWAANPEKHRLYQAKRRAAKSSGGFVVTERDIQRLLTRHRGLCAYCQQAPATDLDHVIPLKLGGKHGIGNLLPACRRCNASKNATLLFRWRVRVLLEAEAHRLASVA